MYYNDCNGDRPKRKINELKNNPPPKRVRTKQRYMRILFRILLFFSLSLNAKLLGTGDSNWLEILISLIWTYFIFRSYYYWCEEEIIDKNDAD